MCKGKTNSVLVAGLRETLVFTCRRMREKDYYVER